MLTDPQLGVYRQAEWPNADPVFSHHIRHVLTEWDRQEWITEIQIERPHIPTEFTLPR